MAEWRVVKVTALESGSLGPSLSLHKPVTFYIAITNHLSVL
jgi:hypothetical protein